ncbi:hypothetical protein BLNAU_3469 [Blattamonas nauphoetae]|uniref:Protein kinase domain-containing protein n=1 Tax=Blattamonas nauphoetae TaxID=2049346 RepID=A0ABQ9YDE2_9EUKA|nr:hypothetical protein BLNAU_3469 [Blattamonas nauphoetae]
MISLFLWFHASVVGAPSFELTDFGLFLAQQDLHTAANSEQTTQTIRLPKTDFVSNTVRFKDQTVGIDGEELILTKIFEGQQARESLISASNSTITLKSLSLETISTRAVVVTDASVCHLSDSHVLVLKYLSPIEISASSLIVDSTRFSFPQSTSPSLCTADSSSSTVLFRQCSFLDVVVESGGSFLTCPKLQQLDVASTRFSNISHCPTYFGADPHVPSFNVSLHDSQFDRCENVLDGGVVRNVNTRTALFASNTTFTLSQTTYTLVPDRSYGQKQALDITTNHNFSSCSFTNCSSTQTHGGAIRCAGGASLAVHSCTFVDNDITKQATTPGRGGAINFEGQSTGGLTFVGTSFLRNTAFYGGAISCKKATSMHLEQGNITEGKCVLYSSGSSCYGGGVLFEWIPSGSIVKNVRFERCSSENTGGSLDNSQMQGSIVYSNILVSESSTPRGNCIFSYVLDSTKISFFSCMFFGNKVTEQVDGKFAGVDIRFSHNTYWETCLTDPASFINCFSTSVGHRILYHHPNGTFFTSFQFLSPPDPTNMSVLLPDPQVIVNIETGRDEDGCGASYDFKCKTLKFVGESMIPMTDGVILVEAGRYEESTTIDLVKKNTTFSSFGTDNPVVVYSGQTPFITKTIGALTLRLFTFVPTSGHILFSQTGAGTAAFSDCEIRLDGEGSTAISEPLFSTTAGTLTLSGMTFTGLVFSGGCCVSCSGSSTTLSEQNSSFVGLSGSSEPCLNFNRDSKGGTLTLSRIEIEGTAGSLIGGITTSNVQTVSVSVTTFSRLMSTSQKAPLSITSCDTLTLSGLLFENCAGQSASSLFIDSLSTVSLDIPIASSFSVCSSPRSSVNGDTTTVFLPHPASITIDPEDGTDGQFCWSTNVGCQSLSGIVDRLMPTSEYTLDVAEGTTSESTLSITSKKDIAVTGLGSARSLMVMQSTAQSFADLNDGSLSLTSLGFTESTSQTGVSRTNSLFDVKGGSLRLENVEFVPLSFSGASSLVKMSGASSLSLKNVSFVSMKNEASGSVLYSTSIGQIELDTVSFTSCNCGVNGKGRSVFIARPSFSSGDVVMKSVSIITAGTTGSHEVYLEGEDVGAVVTTDWTSLIGENDTMTKTQLEQVFGSDSTNSTNIGPLGYHLYAHTNGAVFVSEGFWDHGKCGQERLPCSTLDFAWSLLTSTKTTLSLISDITLSSLLESPSTGASISSSLSSPKSLLFESDGQLIVDAGSLALSSMGLTLPSSLTQPLFVVRGNTLTLSSTVTITNPSSTTHSASLFSVEGGTLTLSGTVFDFTVPFSSTSALLTQTSGTLKLDTVTIENVGCTVGDGSVVHSSLSSSEDKLEIVGCSFSSCSSSGNGGALFVSSSLDHNPANLIIQSTFGTDISCGEGKKGEWIFLRSHSLESYLIDSTWTGSISSLVAPADDALLWGEDGSEKEDLEYVSLSLLYYLKAYNQPTIAVGDGGRDGEGCGRTQLRCSSLSTAVSHLSGSTQLEMEIVPSLSLVKKETFSLSFTMKPSKETATITVGQIGAFEVSANTLTLSTLTFDGKGNDRSDSLLSIVDTGSIAIAGCTFANLKTSGKGSVYSSTLNTDNTLSISESSFSSCSSAGNGGTLFVEVNGGSFVIPTTLTFTGCSSEGKGHNLFIVHSNLLSLLSGGSLDGIKPALPSTGLVSKDEKEKWFGSTSSAGESSSLLFFWHPHTESSGAVHAHENGESHSLCGLPQLPCSLIQPSLSKTTTDNETVIDSDFVLNESITIANTPSTLTSVSKSVIVSVGVDGKFALSSGSLTLSALSFVQSSSVELLEHALISVGCASSSLIVDGCSFSSFRLSLNALIEHSHSSLTLKSSVFTNIVRMEGDGGVVESVMDEGMELDVDSVELASVWTLSGDGDGFFISFNSMSDPTQIPSFKLNNLKYSESAGSERNTDRKACFVWMEGKRLSEWVKVSDARFAGSYSPIGMESEWLWSVDWEEKLNASLLFYLVAHAGAIGVSSSGYSIVQCGYSGVWCLGLEYGMAVANSKGEKQLNIHDTVDITHLIDLNAEYRVHGKVGSSVLSVVGSGGLVVDSGEHVEIDGVSVVVGVDCSSEVLSCVSSILVLHSIVFSCGGDSSSLINTTLICVDGDGSVGRFSSLSLLNGVSSDGKLLLVKKGTVQMTDVWVSSSISESGGLVSVCGGSFSLVNLALPPLSFSSTPFVLSSFDACSFTNLTAKQVQTQTLLTAEHGEDLTLTSCTFDGISTTQNDDQDDGNELLCSWTTGLININDTPTTIYSSFFSHLSKGAIAVNGSLLSLFNTVFIANSANDQMFPSISRNIRCLSGAVEIENEQRDNEESESLWISTDDCVVKKGSELVASGLFVPKLDVGKTKSVSNKNKSVSIDLVGSMLIPCNLFLLISEVGSSSSSDGLRIELTPSKFGWKNESSISVLLSSSELDKLNRTFGWNGTLVFGDGWTTDWFVVKVSESDERKALMKQAMKWMIPLIAGCVVALLVIIIVVVLLRRRSSKAKEKDSLLKQQQAEMNDLPPEKLEDFDKLLIPPSSIVAAEGSVGHLAQADASDRDLKEIQPSFPLGTDNIFPASGEPSADVLNKESKPVGVKRGDTLYNRLHSAQKKPIDKMGVAQQIMRKLVGLHRQDPTLSVLTMFSSHSVVFGEDGEVEIALDVGETMGQTRSQTQRTQTCQGGQRTENLIQTEGERKNEQFELLRWRAPETVVSEGEEGQKVDSGSAAVFSLGLVLFEIETGQVPFGEMDALNASRQLKTGIPPKLSLVGDSGLRDVIVSCLQVRGKDRPGLGEMEEKLQSVEFSCGSAVFFDAAQ